MSYITLEDINTWILKYVDNDDPLIHQAPLVSANHSLYRGNTNDITDLITLASDDIEYNISYQGRELSDTLYVPEDYGADSLRLRITTKSYEPYIGLDVYLDVDVETKEITSINDLNTYSYGEVTELRNLTGIINNDIHLVGGEIRNCTFKVNGNVTFEDMELRSNLITNNGTLTIKDCDVQAGGSVFAFDNNNLLTITDCNITPAQSLVLNKGELNLTNNTLQFFSSSNNPVVHSEAYPNIAGNSFTAVTETTGYGICTIRTQEMNTAHFLSQNTTEYNCRYINDTNAYKVSGDGVAYCSIDDDTIHFVQLEVESL